MTRRVLSHRELNRALLARQLLLERSALPLTDAIEQIGGLQAQYAPSAYIGLWTRLRAFQRRALTTALEQRRVVQATLMRATIHMVSARDFPLLATAIRRGRREWWLRVQGRPLEGIDLEGFATRLRAHLASGPRRQSDLIEALGAEGFPRPLVQGAGMLVDLVRVPPSGTWERRRADLYGLADDWLDAEWPTEAEGLEHLVGRYLGAFGPAAVADIASWAGLPLTSVRPVIERLSVREFSDEDGRQLVDLPDGPLPSADMPAPVRFIPTWDAMLLVHARRTQVLPERYRSLLFNTKNPHSFPTFLVDGAIAGSWRHEKGHVLIEPFDRLAPRVRADVEAEAERLSAFHTGG